jgi:hypothetical protein
MRALGALQRRKDRAADQLVGVGQEPLQRRLHLARVETRQDIDDVHARDRVLAVQPAQKLGCGTRVGDVGDDAKEGGLLVRFLRVGGVEQVAHAEALFLGGDDLEHG